MTFLKFIQSRLFRLFMRISKPAIKLKSQYKMDSRHGSNKLQLVHLRLVHGCRKTTAILFLGISFSFLAVIASAYGFKNVYPDFLTRNPFHTFLYTKKHMTSFKEGELPLMQYSLSSLKIVGIMAREGHYYAMLQTPDGRSYIVSDGSVVGIDRARIESITGNSIIFIEKTFNALGQMHTITIVMKIK